MLRGQSQEIQRATRSRTALVDKTAAANALPAAEKPPAKSAGRDEDAADDLDKNSTRMKELISGERTVEERNAEGFANAIVIDD